jgi:hypothetical protein
LPEESCRRRTGGGANFLKQDIKTPWVQAF